VKNGQIMMNKENDLTIA